MLSIAGQPEPGDHVNHHHTVHHVHHHTVTPTPVITPVPAVVHHTSPVATVVSAPAPVVVPQPVTKVVYVPKPVPVVVSPEPPSKPVHSSVMRAIADANEQAAEARVAEQRKVAEKMEKIEKQA